MLLTLVFIASLSLSTIISSVLYPPNFSIAVPLGLPLTPSIFSRLRYPILFQLALFVIFSHTSLSAMAGNLFSGIFLCIAISTFSRLYLFEVGTFLVLLLILYYSSYLRVLVSFQLLSSALCFSSEGWKNTVIDGVKSKAKHKILIMQKQTNKQTRIHQQYGQPGPFYLRASFLEAFLEKKNQEDQLVFEYSGSNGSIESNRSGTFRHAC